MNLKPTGLWPRIAVAAVALATVCFTGPAQADTYTYSWSNLLGASSAHGHNGGIFDGTLYDQTTNKTIAKYSLCNDGRTIGSSFTTTDVRVLTKSNTDQYEQQAAYLVSKYLRQIATANVGTQGASLQWAVWKLWGLSQDLNPASLRGSVSTTPTTVVEGSVTGLYAGGDDGQANPAQYTADWFVKDAQTNYASWAGSDVLWVLSGPNGGQNQLMAVPEPAFYQLSALMCLGGLGLFRIRRRA